MKLLLDENLSRRLASRLTELFPWMIHVRDVGLQRANDHAIRDWAATNGYTILTTDNDFLKMSQRLGWPPKIDAKKNVRAPKRRKSRGGASPNPKP